MQIEIAKRKLQLNIVAKSYLLCIPKGWVESRGLCRGTQMQINVNESGDLIINPDLEEAKMRAREYWEGRLRHYTIKERNEGHPNIKVAWARLKDQAYQELMKVLMSNLEERLVRLEREVFNRGRI